MGNLYQVINLVWFGAKLRTLQVLKWYWPKMEHVVFLKSFRATQKHSCETGDAISSYLFFFFWMCHLLFLCLLQFIAITIILSLLDIKEFVKKKE